MYITPEVGASNTSNTRNGWVRATSGAFSLNNKKRNRHFLGKVLLFLVVVFFYEYASIFPANKLVLFVCLWPKISLVHVLNFAVDITKSYSARNPSSS
eukprot:scaffold7955_cov93-Cylindrotheca_fusiformis.AAC.7